MQPYEFYVDLTPMQRETPKITASQYDVGRPFIAHIQYKGQPYEIPAGSVVTLHFRKPSGYVLTTEASYDGDAVYFEMEEQMTAESGNVKVEISIVGDGNTPIGTANFRLIIEPSVLENGVVSESQIGEIQQAIDAAAGAKASATAAEQSMRAADQAKQTAQASAESAEGSEESAAQAKADAEAAAQAAKDYRDAAAGYAGAASMGLLMDVDGDVRIFYNPDSE